MSVQRKVYAYKYIYIYFLAASKPRNIKLTRGLGGRDKKTKQKQGQLWLCGSDCDRKETWGQPSPRFRQHFHYLHCLNIHHHYHHFHHHHNHHHCHSLSPRSSSPFTACKWILVQLPNSNRTAISGYDSLKQIRNFYTDDPHWSMIRTLC